MALLTRLNPRSFASAWLVTLLMLTVVAPALSAAQLRLTWKDNSNNETGFVIERATAGGVFAVIARLAPNSVTYLDTNLKASTVYSYRLSAYKDSLKSAYTSVVSATTAALVTATPAPNIAPTISDVASRTIAAQGTTGAIPFTVGDATTPAASLIVTVSSSNTTLFPATALVLGGSGANRTITVRPSGSLSGTATITLRVSDGSLVASDTFAVTVTPPNLPPTLSALASREVETGASTGPIAFTVGDSTTAAGQLVVRAFSSNTTVLPASRLILGGSGSSRTLTLTPPAGVTGIFQVTVSVSDGVYTTTRSFALTVVPFNSPPTLQGAKALTTSTNGRVSLPLTLSDPETAAAQLTLTATSGNTALLASSSIRFEGTGSLRTLVASLVPGQSGSVTISVTVSDGRKSTKVTIPVTVVTKNTAPWITGLVNLTCGSYYMVGQPFTAGDAESSADCLLISATSSNPTLVPASSIYFGGAEPERALAVVPVRGKTGTTLITIRVSDGVLSAVQSFTLTVIP